ncbi:MAG: PepSY domain-containing protein [Nitrospirota bacterium]|nr:PepSY domain-containing protein [Nitrospirota bacterium]
MTDHRHILALLLALLVAPWCGAPALAGDLEYDEMRKLRMSGEIRPLSELLERAQQERKGELLEAELEERDDRLVYEIELLTEDGEVWEFFFDARTGELLDSEQED